MRLNVLSDLHLGFSGFERPRTAADVVVLAGDIARPHEAAAWALGFDKPVFYVPGNHEFYGRSLRDTVKELKRIVAGSHVRVLDDDELVHEGVRFLGSTLWTDFRLCGGGAARDAAMTEARRLMRDFSRIRNDDTDAPFTPEDSAARFARHAAWLQRQLDTPHDGPTVVVTHHAPSCGSIHPRYAGSPLNASFVSDAEHMLGAERVRLWIHGHTHDSFDYTLNGTRVVCNPRGYVKDGVAENARFDPDFVVDV
ncbi:MAG: metallophosphoesterase [Burkholderiaceae bacterium]|nr:metallophosphoesterase [Burkholderiaceae bacterium]